MTQLSDIVPGTVVCFQDQGVPRLGVVSALTGSRFEIVDELGVRGKFSADRFTAFPNLTPTDPLSSLREQAVGAVAKITLPEIWEKCEGIGEAATSAEIITRAGLPSFRVLEHLGLHELLLRDKIYFKQRGQFFQRRSKGEVATRIEQAEKEKQYHSRLDTLVDLIVAALSESTSVADNLPVEIRLLEELAAMGRNAPNYKDGRAVLERIEERSGSHNDKAEEERAFDLLVRIGRFSPDQNLTLIRLGLDQVKQPKLMALAERIATTRAEPVSNAIDLTDLECFSIDSSTTEDFDDALSVEELPNGGLRMGIHITDVWSALKTDGDALDEALMAGASTYLPDRTIHMLPPELSENLLSLRAGEKRSAVSLLVSYDRDFLPTEIEFRTSVIRVAHNLSYEKADELLGGEQNPELSRLWKIASALEAKRLANQSFSFDRPELSVLVSPSGEVSLLCYNNDSPARKMVGELMVLFNAETAKLGKRLKVPFLYRSQREPDEDPASIGLDIPEGPARDGYQRSVFQRTITSCRPLPHAGLGLDCYVQATSPLRRAIDLLNQAQLLRAIEGSTEFIPPKKMLDLYREIEPALDRINLAQRERIKYFLLRYLQSKKVTQVTGTLVKYDYEQFFVELDETFLFVPFKTSLPALNRDQVRKQLGRRVRLEITDINPRAGTISLVEI